MTNESRNQGGYPIESPFAPDLTRIVDELMTKMEKPVDNQNDKMTPSQDVLSVPIDTIQNSRATIQQATEYIKRTKQVINTLHEIIDTLKQKDQLQKQLLKHCLTQLENPKPRNQDLIINAIKQHLGEK